MEEKVKLGLFEAVSISSQPIGTPETTRSITMFTRPGEEGDDYGGWKQNSTLHDIEKISYPDDVNFESDDTISFGFDDKAYYKVTKIGENEVEISRITEDKQTEVEELATEYAKLVEDAGLTFGKSTRIIRHAIVDERK